METNDAFVGFEEASIDFPPTFKYDVAKSKRSRHKSLRRISKALLGEADQIDVAEHVRNGGKPPDPVDDEDNSDDEPEADGEAASMTSTTFTTQSRCTADGDEQQTDREDYFIGTSARTNLSTGHLVSDAKVLSSAAVHKAKAKWISLISKPQSPVRKWGKPKDQPDGDQIRSPLSSPPLLSAVPSPLLLPSSPQRIRSHLREVSQERNIPKPKAYQLGTRCLCEES